MPAQLVTEHVVPFEDTLSSTDLLFAEVIAGEGEGVDEEPEQGGDAQGQTPGGLEVITERSTIRRRVVRNEKGMRRLTRVLDAF